MSLRPMYIIQPPSDSSPTQSEVDELCSVCSAHLARTESTQHLLRVRDVTLGYGSLLASKA